VDKKVEKKEHKIKKIIYEGDCSINSNSDEEQYIRKFERQSRRSNGIANYRKEAEENNKTKENSEWKNKTKDEISNTIPPKHSNDNKEEDKCKTEAPKKTVTLNENLNTSYHANTQSSVNNSIEQKFTDRCYIVMENSILVNFVLSGIDSQCKIIIEVIIRDMEGGNVQRALGQNSIRNTEESIPARRPGWNQNYNQYDKCTSRSNRGNSTSFPIKFVNN
jgi:hypothetical protein